MQLERALSDLALSHQPITECWPHFRIGDNRPAILLYF
jgi:hypothetical protein